MRAHMLRCMKVGTFRCNSLVSAPGQFIGLEKVHFFRKGRFNTPQHNSGTRLTKCDTAIMN